MATTTCRTFFRRNNLHDFAGTGARRRACSIPIHVANVSQNERTERESSRTTNTKMELYQYRALACPTKNYVHAQRTQHTCRRVEPSKSINLLTRFERLFFLLLSLVLRHRRCRHCPFISHKPIHIIHS